jgi:DNA adenine methylase
VTASIQIPALSPPLKWAGGKRWLAPRLAPYWKLHRECRFVEPFCGALGVALSLAPRWALLNDSNPHLMHFLRCLKNGLVIDSPPEEETASATGDNVRFLMEAPYEPEKHSEQIDLGLPAGILKAGEAETPGHYVLLQMRNDKNLFYQHRGRFNELLRTGAGMSPETAALFYFLNRTGFNGLCRFNRQGEFNVPFGKYSAITYQRDFLAYRIAFANWEFTCSDFESLPLRPTDFVYADPPYDVEFTQYSKDVFGWEEQERTARWLARHPGPVILSNQGTNRIVALYRELGYRLEFLKGPRRISCNGDRSPAKEVLAFRNLPELPEPTAP